jgi:large subunit ribosomal protein L25
MKEIVLSVESRQDLGKNGARRLRRSGRIPGIVYGAGQEPMAVGLDPKSLLAIMHSQTGANTLFFLELDGKRDSHTRLIIHDVQYDPVSDRPVHVDLSRVRMEQEMRVKVPVQVEGVAKGVKLEGGILDFITRDIEVMCLPANIPDHIRIDVSELGIGDSIKVAQLPKVEGYRILTEPERTVVVVAAPVEEKVEEAATAAAEITEPEVIKKGKEEPVAEEGGAAPAKEAGKKEKEKEREK